MEKYMSKIILKMRNESLKTTIDMVKEDKFPAVMSSLAMLLNEAERLAEGVDIYLESEEKIDEVQKKTCSN